MVQDLAQWSTMELQTNIALGLGCWVCGRWSPPEKLGVETRVSRGNRPNLGTKCSNHVGMVQDLAQWSTMALQTNIALVLGYWVCGRWSPPEKLGVETRVSGGNRPNLGTK